MLLEIFRLLHLIGLAFGLGGATLAVIISTKAEKNPELGPSVMKIMPAISKFIWLGYFLLVISGIALPFFIEWPINKNLLIIKHVLVAIILIFGILIGIRIKKVQRLVPKPKEKPSLLFLKYKKQINIFGKISLIFWYAITILSMFV